MQVLKLKLEKIIKNPLKHRPDVLIAVMIAKEINSPLHPFYTYHWNSLSKYKLIELVRWIKTGKKEKKDDEFVKIILKNNEKNKEIS